MAQTTPSGSVRFNCPLCGTTVEAPCELAGNMSECPGCNKPIKIPAAVAGSRPTRCPSCGALLSASSPRCPHCGLFVPTGKPKAVAAGPGSPAGPAGGLAEAVPVPATGPRENGNNGDPSTQAGRTGTASVANWATRGTVLAALVGLMGWVALVPKAPEAVTMAYAMNVVEVLNKGDEAIARVQLRTNFHMSWGQYRAGLRKYSKNQAYRDQVKEAKLTQLMDPTGGWMLNPGPPAKLEIDRDRARTYRKPSGE